MKNTVKYQNIKKYFELEKKRTLLAIKRDFQKLKDSYSQKVKFEDLNTGKKWDKQNFDSEINFTNNPMAADRTNLISKLVSYSNKSTLNIGFGPSNLEKIILKNNFIGNWEGIDISSRSINNAKKLFPKHTFIKKSILDTNLKKSKYDIVLSLEVLEHISPNKIFRVLEKIYNSMKNGGFFIVSIPINEGLENMITKGSNPNAHFREYSRDLIKAELEMTGFNVLKIIPLYAFHRFYFVKKNIAKFVPQLFTENNLIVLAQKS